MSLRSTFQLVLFCILLLYSYPTWGASQTDLITPEIDGYIKTVIQQWNLTGLAVAIVRQEQNSPKGWHQEFRSYGVAKADGTPVTPDTLFALASNSKLVTGLATGLLISNETLKKERGIDLSWSTKAGDVFGDLWGLMDEEASRGTSIRDMLSHRTGLPRHDGSSVQRQGGLVDKIKTLRYLRPSAEFRDIYQYCNPMYDSLGYLPEALVNQTLGSYVEQHFFIPLNMSGSTYSVMKAESGLLADGFQVSGQDLKRGLSGSKKAIAPFFVRPGEEYNIAGSGGLIASARDMATWTSMLLGLGHNPLRNDSQVVPTEVIEQVATGSSIATGGASFPETSVPLYGAGQISFSYRGYDVVEHDGGLPGFSSWVTRLPNDNLGIVLLNNDWTASPSFALEAIKRRLIDELVVRTGVSGSPLIDWISSLKCFPGIKPIEEELKDFTPRPDNPALPSLPFSDLQQRRYSHPTYGTLIPCLVPNPSLIGNGTEQTSLTTIGNCSTIINSLPVQRILDISDPSIPTFIIPFIGVFTTHLRLSHFTEDTFNATAIWTNAEVRLEEGFGSIDENGHWTDDGDVVVPLIDFVVEWVTEGEEGLAFRGNFWGMGVGAQEPSGAGKEGAEVWFSRVKA